MSRITVFECNVCGKRHGHINEMFEFTLLFGSVSMDVHVEIDHPDTEAISDIRRVDSLSGDGHVVMSGSVVNPRVDGIEINDGDTFIERSALSDEFIELIEEDVL